MPEFPLTFVTEDDQSTEIMVRLVVNDHGRVDRVIYEEPVTEPGHEPFMESIRKAVANWIFSPLMVIRPTDSGASSEIAEERVTMPVSLWYQFRFTIGNGRPTTTMKERSS